MHSFEVSASYVRLILQVYGDAADTVLEGTGLTQDGLKELEFVSWQTFARVLDGVERSANSSEWPLRLGERLNITSHGAVGFAALTAPTVGEAMETLATCYRARITAVDMVLQEEQDMYVLSLQDLTGDPVFFQRVSLIILKVIEALLEALLGQLPANSIDMTLQGLDGSQAQRIALLCRVNVRLGNRFAVAIPGSWRNLPSPLQEQALHRENVMESRRIISQRGVFPTTAETVNFLLRSALDSVLAGGGAVAVPPLSEVASRTNVTPRTLIRRLKTEGTSYRYMVESLRREYAERLLRNTSLSVAEVADRLGYTESANFGRAFRRWYGLPPAIWRKKTPER